MLLKIAWRNVWRSKLRSSVVILAIASGLIGGLASTAWMNGMADQRIESTFAIETAHIQLHNKTFNENFEITKTIDSTNYVLNEVRKIKGVKSATSRISIQAMASTASNNTGVTLIGVDKEMEKEVSMVYSKIDSVSGNYLETKSRVIPTIVVSKALAKELKLKLKSKIILTFQNYNGDLNGSPFKVVGIYKTDNSKWDKRFVFAKQSDLRRLASVPKDETHEIAILVDNYNEAKKISEIIQNKFPQIKSEDWAVIQPYTEMMTSYMGIMMYVFMSIILAALGFGIVNTMLMVILERTRELGMLMAIGMSGKRIFIMIMLETVFLSLVGAIVGEILSYTLIEYLGVAGIDLSSMAQGIESVGFSVVSYPKLDLYSYVEITIMVFITSVIASIYPAYKAVKLNPTEAIRSI